jgi:glycosyltransferase involved in cell wall biosynthesis
VRIALDADPIGRDGSGNETYLRGLVGGLQPALGTDDELILMGRQPAALRAVADARTSVLAVGPGLAGEVGAGRRARRAGADVFVAHYQPPLRFGGPVVSVVHDVSFRRHPEAFPRLLRLRIEATVAWAVRVSAVVVAGSEFSRRELLDVYPRLTPDRIVVTPYAADPCFFEPLAVEDVEAVRRRHRLPERFVLAVGNLQPRKNLVRLSMATARLGMPLVAVGRPGWQADRLRQEVAPGAITWLGHVAPHDLRALYRACTVFAYPSLYEGFGLPILEAMASGAPVVTSSVAAMPEVAGTAAVLVDPLSVDDIALGIGEVIDSPARRDELRDRGRARAAEFSWARSAAALLAELRRVGGRPGATG